jgi:hypothetical protein
VDLIVGGHTHQFLNAVGLEPENLVNGIPILQAGWRGLALGEARLRVGQSVTTTAVRLSPITELPLDERFAQQVLHPIFTQLKQMLQRPIGRWQVPPEHNPTSSWDLGTGESGLANFMTDTLFSRCRLQGYPVDLAMIDSAFLQCNFPENGGLTYGQLMELLPYNDPLYLYQLDSRQLLALLRDNALRINRPGEAQLQRGFLHFSANLRYAIYTQTGAGPKKILWAQLKGRALEAYHKTFLIACPAFTRQAALAWEHWVQRVTGYQPLRLHSLPHAPTHLYSRNEILEHLMLTQGITLKAGVRCDGRLQLVGEAGDMHMTWHKISSSVPSQAAG